MSIRENGNVQSFPPEDAADLEIAFTFPSFPSPPRDKLFAEDGDSVSLFSAHEGGGNTATGTDGGSATSQGENVDYDEILELRIRGTKLRQQFEDLGNLADIAEAISLQKQAIQLIPVGHAYMPVQLNSLQISLNSRFQRTGDLSDLSEAISVNQRAVQLTPNGDSDKPYRLATLGNLLRTRFQRTGDLTDISEAISAQQEALQLTPKGHNEMPFRLSNLGISFQSRFERTRATSDILQAISTQQQAALLAKSGSFDKPYVLNNLADAFHCSFQHTGDPQDISIAMSTYRKCARTPGRPSTRLEAARRWAELTIAHDFPQSIEAYGAAVDLISQVAGMGSTVEERHRDLVDISSLTTAAAAAAFTLGEFRKALEWLEQGRCLVWSQLNQLRTPADDLRAHDEHLGQRFLRISRALESSGSRRYEMYPSRDAPESQKLAVMDTNSEYSAHLDLSREWTQLLQEIRQIPAFHGFLQPPQATDLLSNLPPDGPIILVNIHESRCDALALVSGLESPIHIPLNKFSYKKASGLKDRLRNFLSSNGVRMRDTNRGGQQASFDGVGEVHNVLKALWVLVVKPIWDRLGYSNKTPSDKIRIWWCATGPLAFLPLHAAGIYNQSEPLARISCISDFAVSSYTPTVSALLDKVKRSVDVRSLSPSKLLIISQPNSPGCSPLPGATEEMNTIQKTIGSDHCTSLEATVATISKVKLEMQSHGSIHFACHASQNIGAPLKSGFYLDDGRLELAELMKQNIAQCDLAFLSACQTSTGDEKLSEEAVHLAAGMLAVGYRGVVATLWSIKDEYGPVVAEGFYKYLMEHGGIEGKMRLDGASAARALHHAIQSIRERPDVGDTEKGLMAWVPYVHFGY